MNIRLISFTDRGAALAKLLAEALGGTADRGIKASEWTERYFGEAEALIFVGAAGIAVRSIAPHLKNKALDPAVVVVDEGGRFAIPILSGHLGGANDLARRIGEICGSLPVITTGTDVSGKFAVDEWARRQNFALLEPERILPVSARILKGETVTVTSEIPISGTCPSGVRLAEDGLVRVGICRDESSALHLVPGIGVLGVGCKRGTTRETLEAVFEEFCIQNRFYPECVAEAVSIDVKADEPGLLEFCKVHGWEFTTFSAGALAEVPGEYSDSAFVEKTVGVGCVCERAAVLGSRGVLIFRKYAKCGVTMALALRPCEPDWRWQYE
ncbi:MAG: cobalamin biosynthesis protein [Lachnospiraceae bacterium]|nr:cobalamin biosynthesis protein [Lachnospiraceae bacterium]